MLNAGTDSMVDKTLSLLQQLVSIPSFSSEEAITANVLYQYLQQEGAVVNRLGNNVWALNKFFNPAKPTILLNSHHDTVKPNPGYTRNPFNPEITDGKLYGLGSNDAGGALTAMIAAFLYFLQKSDLKFNIILAATAEEEISGSGGIESIWSLLPHIDFAIVGEPTGCKMAIAEKGLLVLDCVAQGRAGHAARDEGDNAIYKALKDIEWFRTYQFERVSKMLGPVKMTVTRIDAGTLHNIVPAECRFTVDVRVTDAYTLEEVLAEISKNVLCEVRPRSVRLKPSGINVHHPLVNAARKLGIETFGSPTTSDQALIPVPSVKIGPGDSARSHMADEFIFIDEIAEGIKTYIQLLNAIELNASASVR